MAQGQSGGMDYRVSLEGADVVINATRELSAELRKMTNREFRDAARDMSEEMARQIRTGRYARGGAPQALKVARTAVYKRDRLPMVKIPGTRVGLSGQSKTRSFTKTGRLSQARTKGTLGRKEDLAISWAATGGLPNPHFPGSTYWIKNVYDDAEELGAREWLEAVNEILRNAGL